MNDESIQLILNSMNSLVKSNIADLRNDMNNMVKSNIEDLRNDMNEKFNEVYAKFDENDKRFDAYDEQLQLLSNEVIKIEYEHGQKLDIIFDAITSNNEKFENFKNEKKRHDKKIYNHDLRIEILEEKIV